MLTSQYTNISFISYKREDEEWAKWLQKEHKVALELAYPKIPTKGICPNQNQTIQYTTIRNSTKVYDRTLSS